MHHGEEVVGEFIIAGCDATEVLQLREEPFDQVALAVEALAEAGFPFSIGFGRNIRRSSLLFDQCANAVGIVGFISEHDGARPEMVEQRVRDLPVMRLSRR
ncbi:hypothetical protein IH86_11400 [Sphingobium yanoikuyae]|nr:hypothetical protein IH86_11400 [Sphingobium yanoikuyae]TKV44085.1 hypothetical protein A0U87_10425 [Sphingobium sp. MP9-4]